MNAETRDGPFGHQRGVLIFERFQTADAAADEDAEAIAIHFIKVDAGIAHRTFCCGHREMRKPIRPLVFLGIVKNRLRIEIANLARDAAIVARGVEARDLDNPAASFEQVLPEGLKLEAQRRGHANAGDDDPAVHEEVISDK